MKAHEIFAVAIVIIVLSLLVDSYIESSNSNSSPEYDLVAGWHSEDQVDIIELTESMIECSNKKYGRTNVNGREFGNCLLPSYNSTSILYNEHSGEEQNESAEPSKNNDKKPVGY